MTKIKYELTKEGLSEGFMDVLLRKGAAESYLYGIVKGMSYRQYLLEKILGTNKKLDSKE
jgi:hypothetical protein